MKMHCELLFSLVFNVILVVIWCLHFFELRFSFFSNIGLPIRCRKTMSRGCIAFVKKCQLTIWELMPTEVSLNFCHGKFVISRNIILISNEMLDINYVSKWVLCSQVTIGYKPELFNWLQMILRRLILRVIPSLKEAFTPTSKTQRTVK